MKQYNPNLDVFSNDLPCWQKGQHGGVTRPMNRDIAYKNLCEIHKVLDRFEIKHWLSHGTMLGAYRDNNLIQWDDDVDLGMDFSQRGTKNFDKAMATLVKKGYYIPPSDPNRPVDKDNCPYYDMVAIKDGEKVEGWFFEKKDDFYIYDFPRCGNILKHPAKFYDDIQNVFNFKGVKFDIPNDIEEWLVMMYGPDWNVPNPDKKYNHQS